MKLPYNGLTNAEAERLAILAEECSETAQAAMKILRHGWDEYHPDDKDRINNRELLRREILDIRVVTHKMALAGDINMKVDKEEFDKVYTRKRRWMHHQGD